MYRNHLSFAESNFLSNFYATTRREPSYVVWTLRTWVAFHFSHRPSQLATLRICVIGVIVNTAALPTVRLHCANFDVLRKLCTSLFSSSVASYNYDVTTAIKHWSIPKKSSQVIKSTIRLCNRQKFKSHRNYRTFSELFRRKWSEPSRDRSRAIRHILHLLCVCEM